MSRHHALAKLAAMLVMMPGATAFAFLNQSTYRNADCSAAQVLTTSSHPLNKCVASKTAGTWYTYTCSTDGQTFQEHTFHDAKCSGVPSTYSGTAGQCVQNMGYTFSSFTCVANTTTISAAAAAAAAAIVPTSFIVDFHTDIDGVGVISVNVTRALAPLGADHLHELVLSGFYDGAAFFRVVGGFVLQFGIAGVPSENVKWASPIKDDPVVGSNSQLTMTYATAGPNTRTTQLFINYKDNSNLDSQGFAPLGKVIAGQQYLTRVNDPTPGNSGGVDQTAYETKGDTWIRSKYPEINFIKKATIRSEANEAYQGSMIV